MVTVIDALNKAKAALDQSMQFISEVCHAREVGPDWYTRGESGLFQQIGAKIHKTVDAVKPAQAIIDAMPSTIGQISDGYHTFDELYEHRFELWMAICRNLRRDIAVYKSRVQSDGTSYPGWFLLAMGTKAGGQISYHLPDRLWDACDFEEMMPPKFDGHTSADVLERLRSL